MTGDDMLMIIAAWACGHEDAALPSHLEAEAPTRVAGGLAVTVVADADGLLVRGSVRGDSTVQVGDVLLRVAGVSVVRPDGAEAMRAVLAPRVGEEVEITLRRGDMEMTVVAEVLPIEFREG